MIREVPIRSAAILKGKGNNHFPYVRTRTVRGKCA